MRQDHDGRRSGVHRARELGWDDGLYAGPDGRGGREGRTRQATLPRQRAAGGPGAGRPPSGPGRAGRRRAKPRRRRVLRWVAIVLSVVILGAAGGGYLYLEHLNGNIEKSLLNLGDRKLDGPAPNAAGQTPLNILLLGSDSRNSEENLKLGGAKETVGNKPRADLQMLLHLSADRSNISVVSIPRDTKVDIPKCTGEDGEEYPAVTDKINSSMQRGGPGCTVATWESLTGIPINHFMRIEFAGVVSMADAVGGVPVCVEHNIHDEKSGLKLRKGETSVKGEQALQWLRTRYAFGDGGIADGTDIGRAKAQHMYMASMVRELKAGTKLTDPVKLNTLATAATEALHVDDALADVADLADLAAELRKVPTERITMLTMPWEYIEGGRYVGPKPEAEQVFSLVRQDVALDGKDEKKPKPAEDKAPEAAPEDQIAVTVQNGTGSAAQAPVGGRAAEVAKTLTDGGFTQAATEGTPKSQTDTTVSYPDEGRRGDALAVAKALGVPERLVQQSAGIETVTVVVGGDWREGDTYPKAAAEDEDAPEKATEDADALKGNDRSCMPVKPEARW